MSVIGRGVRNAFRNIVRTTSLVTVIGLTVGLALTMVVARQAINTKITSIKGAVGNTITISPAGSRGFQGGGTALTTSQISTVSSLDHVQAIVSTLSDRLTTTNTNLVSSIEAGSLGRRFNTSGDSGSAAEPGPDRDSAPSQTTSTTFTLPVTLTGTSAVTSSALSNGPGGGGTLTITSGKAFATDSVANEAVVGTALATKNNLTVGSTFTAYTTTITVVGLYDAGNSFSNGGLLMPLATVQRLSDQAGSVTGATITVDSVSNLTTTTAAIEAKLGTAADVTTTEERATEAIAPLENIAKISLISLIGALVAGAVIILLTMLMIVRERRREIGILKAIGATNIKVMAQFMTEAVTFTGLGALVGLVIGALAASPVTKLLATSASSATSTTGRMPRGFGGGRVLQSIGLSRDNLTALHAAVSWDILLYGLGAAIIIALLGSAIPAFLIAKVRPAEVMRAE